MKDIFITGIDTDIGKTITSAIFVEALACDYWKPIQCGNLDLPDKKVVNDLIQNNASKIHKESFQLNMPASPNIAAKVESKKIRLEDIHKPVKCNRLIIEGAGGCLVPLNSKEFIIEIAQKFNCAIVVVSRNYVGSINHTLLTIQEIRKRKCDIWGIVFNKEENPEIENTILGITKLPKLMHIYPEKKIDKITIKNYATKLKEKLNLLHLI